MTNEKDPKISAKICFDTIELDPELYRIGHTKARKKHLCEFQFIEFVYLPGCIFKFIPSWFLHSDTE